MTEVARPLPFLLNGALQSSPLGRKLERLLEGASGLRRLQEGYDSLPRGLDTDAFLTEALRWLRVEPAADVELAHVPRSGGAVLVANHPFGAVEGLVMALLLRRLRPDVRFLANGLLGRVPEVAPLVISVDPFGGAEAERRNRTPMRQAIRWVQDGGLLVVFPAGEVSHLQVRQGAVVDPAWHSAVARIVARTGAPVVPAFVPGRNSLAFQVAGLVHPRLRTAMLARELLNKAGYRLAIRFGAPIQPDRLDGLTPDELVAFLRLRCYGLAEQPSRPAALNDCEPIAAPQDPAALATEVDRLDSRAKLVESGALRVYCAPAGEIPLLLQEIGRREKSPSAPPAKAPAERPTSTSTTATTSTSSSGTASAMS